MKRRGRRKETTKGGKAREEREKNKMSKVKNVKERGTWKEGRGKGRRSERKR